MGEEGRVVSLEPAKSKGGGKTRRDQHKQAELVLLLVLCVGAAVLHLGSRHTRSTRTVVRGIEIEKPAFGELSGSGRVRW